MDFNFHLLNAGTMSGGGKQVMRGRMGRSVAVSTDTGSVEEVSKLEKTVTRLEEQLNSIRENERTSEEVVSRCAPMIRTMKMNINKLTIEIEVNRSACLRVKN